ncbi:DUF192 domain-containing protein [Alkalicoccus saliphilus]|uniref:DUF192 domain-containing protein n=1 Tax=Alkalicoccus saliphilus TaxID=200989 RepID=A0A2T4U6X5_9BACI|nr:DUF192 domain-containing protein [Alkalicoccus saliphilus]PTL39142.1 DUF192 domain-containing protein [Alkalicoccus saliphilus]
MLVETIPLKKADTWWQRFKGLMLQKEVREALWIVPCNSIHMFFMCTSIDVLFLDEEDQIIHFRENLKPWRLVFPVKKAKSVVELPPGFVQRNALEEGQIIRQDQGYLHVDRTGA